MEHLYEDKNAVRHACHSGTIGGYTKVNLVWTLCGRDVPANESFKSKHETATCVECVREQAQEAGE